MFFVPVIAAILASHQSVAPAVVTVMFVVFYGASSVLSPYVGRVADRSGRSAALMALGLALVSLGLLGFYVALSATHGAQLVATLLISAFLTGTGSAFYHPLGGSMLQAAFRDRRMGVALGINGAMGGLGRALYPSLYFAAAAVIAGYGSFVLFAGVGFAAAASVLVGTRRPAEASTDDARPTGPRTSEAVTRGIVALTAVTFLRSAATQGIATWIPTYLATEKGLGVSADLGLSVSTMYAAAIVGQPLFGLLVDRFEKRLVLAASSAGAAVAIVGYLALGSGWAGLAWLFAFGFFVFSGFPLLISMTADYVPRNSTSLANALVWGIGSTAGGAVGPLATGALIVNDYGRLSFAFVVLAGAALLSALATAFVPRAPRASRMPAFG